MGSDLSVMPANAGAMRAADSLLRSLGGRSVLLRLPGNAVPDSDQEQLGLTTPTFQDMEIAPVLYRKVSATVSDTASARYELLVSAAAIAGLVGPLGYSSASALFALAVGVVVDQMLMEITSATATEAFGQAYLYRLELRAPLQQRV